MQLRVISGQQLENTDTVRAILAEYEGEEAVDLFLNKGSATLSWEKGESTTEVVRVAIPLPWMREAQRTSELEEAVRYFAAGVRLARK